MYYASTKGAKTKGIKVGASNYNRAAGVVSHIAM